MTKYSKYMPLKKPRKTMNPIWRGIGCLLMILVPILSYGIAYLLLQIAKTNNLLPPDLLGYLQFPEWSRKIPALAWILRYFTSVEDFWAKVVIFIIVLLILSGLISLVYSILYQVVGPSRYSELDSPPENRKARVFKR